MKTAFNRYLLVLLAGASCYGVAQAQNYPSRPVHILTGPAGGGSDLTARLVAGELRGLLGQPVLVENRAQITLPAATLNAPPDGHTLLMNGPMLWTWPLLQKADYDMRDFAPITTLTKSPYLLIVTPSLPVKSVADLIKLAKAKPGQLNYSSDTNGSATHIAGELFKTLANVNIQRVVYTTSGSNEGNDLLSGQIQMTFATAAKYGPMIKAGKLRALASTGPKPSILFPDLPAVAETVPGYQTESMFAFFAPSKAPAGVVKRINTETLKTLGKPEIHDKLVANGVEVGGGTPEQLAAAIKSDVTVLSTLIKDGIVKAEEN